MKVSKKAWLPGAKWIAKNRPSLIAIIVGPKTYGGGLAKTVWMHEECQYRHNRAVQGSYSHKHMLKHFYYTGEVGEIDKTKELI